jgi:ribosomal protein S18 acetylase RimI-like enzyme
VSKTLGDPSSSVRIERAEHVDDELVDAFERLIPQLSSSSPAPSAEQLGELVSSPDTVLFLARVDGRIQGSLTLAFYRIPTGLKAWIEDVVVDGDARGHGVAAELSLAAMAEARARQAKNVSLTSRPARDVANRLYQRIGFEPYDTNVYRYTF